MRLREQVEDGIEIFALEGEIDLHYAPVLRGLLQSKIKAGCPSLILDLTKVDYIDSTGLAAIIEYFRDTTEQGHILALAGLTENVKTIFEIVRLDKTIPIFPSVAEAKKAISGGSVRPTLESLSK